MKTFPFLLLLALGGLATRAGEPPPPRPSILVCIADDWSYGHASIYGDPVVHTPNFDRVAREGALFHHAACTASSCTPSRGAILTGLWPHQLEAGGNLWSALPAKFPVYPGVLATAGYAIGCEGKGWAPGDWKAGGWKENPAGPATKFEHFLAALPADRPFCFWYGSHDPHRPYVRGSGLAAGLDPAKVRLPSFWPDTPAVRSDLLDYYFAVQRFDRRVGEILAALQKAGRLDDTLVIVTSDNGMPFPHGKATCYELGTRMPLAMRWPARIAPGTVIQAPVSQISLAPTFLEAAGVPPAPGMEGPSLWPLLTGATTSGPEAIFTERERHAQVRAGNAGYPVRAIRTGQWLYLRNLRPDRWPAGDPTMVFSVGEYGDIDPGPTKDAVIKLRDDPAGSPIFNLSMGKRPAEELYDLEHDPEQRHNLAGNTELQATQADLAAKLAAWMKASHDPRAESDDDRWDQYPYYGSPGREKAAPPNDGGHEKTQN